jgi:hypothetical protein
MAGFVAREEMTWKLFFRAAAVEEDEPDAATNASWTHDSSTDDNSTDNNSTDDNLTDNNSTDDNLTDDNSTDDNLTVHNSTNDNLKRTVPQMMVSQMIVPQLPVC